MKTDFTIEQLAGLRINNLICILEPDNNRWIEIISFRGWNDDFYNWLKENDFECVPRNAKKFISQKEKEIYSEQDWKEFLKNKKEYEDTWHNISFYNILELRLKENKEKPYEGKFGIGHFLGIKKNVNDNPYEYKEHLIGQIEDYKEEPDGHISTYVLSKDDNTEVILPIEMTYRIY